MYLSLYDDYLTIELPNNGGREFGEPLPEYILGEIDILLGESSHFANTLLYAGEQLNNFANDPKFGERVPYYGELENKHDK